MIFSLMFVCSLMLFVLFFARSDWKRFRFALKRSAVMFLAVAIVITALPIMGSPVKVRAASHAHTDNCYLGVKHICSSYGGSCYTSDDEYVTCSTCGGSGTEEVVIGQEPDYCSGCEACEPDDPFYDGAGSWCDGSGVTWYDKTEKRTCSSCSGSGGYWDYDYYKSCGKINGAHYIGNSQVLNTSCNQVVTSLTPVAPTQTLAIGGSPNVQAVATFLDGSSNTVTCTFTGFNTGVYNTPQTVTLSYGAYSDSAKIAQPKKTTMTVTILGNFTLTVFSDDEAKGTVSGGGSVVAGSSTTVKATPKAGYSFAGWYRGAVLVSNSAAYTFTMPAANDSLMAKFTVNSYVVTFLPNGGVCDTPQKSVTYKTPYGTLPVPNRTGYIFTGWTLDGSPVTSSTVVTKTANHDLTAQWLVNQYNLKLQDLNGVLGVTPATYDYGQTVTAFAGTKNASWFTGWTVVSGDGSFLDLSSDTITFPMPAYDLILRANWNDVVSVTASLNESFYAAYADVYDASKGFNLDKGDITVTKDMIDLFVVYEDDSRQIVTNTDYFSLSGNVVHEVGNTSPVITLENITKSDGTKFQCSVNILAYSKSLTDSMDEIGIGSYEELAAYIASLKSEHEIALGKLAEYQNALETFRDQLNSADGNDIILDQDLTSNIGKIEKGIETILSEISAYEDKLKEIQDAILDAGGDTDGDGSLTDGQIETILKQITDLKDKLAQSQQEADSLKSFVNDLRDLLALEKDASLSAIYDAIAEMKKQLERKEEEIKDYSNAMSEIHDDIYGEGNRPDGAEDTLLEATNGVQSIKIDLLAINGQLAALLYQTQYIVNGSSDVDTLYEAETITQEIADLQSYITAINQNIADTLQLVNDLKALLSLEEDATLQEVYEKVAEMKDSMETTIRTQNALIENLQATLQDRNNAIAGMETIIQTQNQTIEELNALLKERNNTIDELNKNISEKNIIISEKDSIIQILVQERDRKDQTISEQEKEIADLTEKNAENDREISDLNDRLQEKDQQLQEKNEELQEKDQQLQEKETIIREKETIITEKETSIKELLLVVEDMNTAVADQKNLTESEQQKVNSINQRLEEVTKELDRKTSEEQKNDDISDSSGSEEDSGSSGGSSENTTSSEGAENVPGKIHVKDYNGIRGAGNGDYFTGIVDENTGIVRIEEWNTSSGMILGGSNYLLSFFDDYVWVSSIDTLFNGNFAPKKPKKFHDAIFYGENTETGDVLTFIIDTVVYVPDSGI